MRFEKQAKTVLLMAVLNIVLYTKNLLLIPILARYLGVATYGLWINIQTLVDFCVPFCLLDLHTAVKRFLAAETEGDQIAKGFWTALQISLVLVLLVGVGLWVGSPVWGAWLAGENAVAVAQMLEVGKWVGTIMAFGVLAKFSLSYFQTFQHSGFYAGLICWGAMAFVTLTYVMARAGWGLWSPMFAMLCAEGSVALIGLLVVGRRVGVCHVDRRVARIYLLYALPLVAYSILYWVIQLSDRYMLTYFIGVESVSQYVVNYFLGSIITFLFSPVVVFMLPTAAKLWEEGKKKEMALYLTKSIKFPTLVALPAIVVISVIGDSLIPFWAGANFVGDQAVIALVMLGYLAMMLGTIFSVVLQVAKDTRSILWINLIATLANIVLNLYLIPWIGILGAALSTAGAFGIQMVLFFLVGTRHFPYSWDQSWLLKASFSAGVATLAVFLLWQHLGASLMVSLSTGVLVYMVMVSGLKVVSRGEWDFIRHLTRQVFSTLSFVRVKRDH